MYVVHLSKRIHLGSKYQGVYNSGVSPDSAHAGGLYVGVIAGPAAKLSPWHEPGDASVIDHGWRVDAAAPGGGVVSSFLTHGRKSVEEFSGYAKWSGSSFAAPYVAGRIADLMTAEDMTARTPSANYLIPQPSASPTSGWWCLGADAEQSLTVPRISSLCPGAIRQGSRVHTEPSCDVRAELLVRHLLHSLAARGDDGLPAASEGPV